MTQRELSAWVMVLGAVVVSAWVAFDAMRGGMAASVSEAAWKMLWAIGYSIVFNIAAVIIGTIGFAIVNGGGEVSDERADERDRLINGKAMRNAYFALSISVLGVLIWQAFGLAPVAGPYVLFAAAMLAGAVFAVSQIAYYRFG